MQKVSLTKLQTVLLGLSLKESKENVDRLLDGEEVVISADTLEQAQKFTEQAQRIGAECQTEVSSTAASA